MMTLLIVILVMASVKYSLIKNVFDLAFRQDKIYLLLLLENVNVASSKNKNSSSYENVTKKRK